MVKVILKQAPQFRDLVTFIPNKREPIHNWYYFKEGFSKELVDYFIKNYGIESTSRVLDPFCGVGTTLLTCKQNGIKSIGIDVNPLFAFVSKVKTQDYDLSVLEKDVKKIVETKRERPRDLPHNDFLKKALSSSALEDVVFYRNKISEIENRETREFMMLALIDSTTKGSWLIKDGALLRIQKQGRPPVGKLFRYKIRRMLKDLKKSSLNPIETEIVLQDSRNIDFEKNSIDCVITSPPYLNKIEYTKIYKLELLLFFDYPESSLRSYIGEGELYDIGSGMPTVAANYFEDLEKVFRKLYDFCKSNAKLFVIIGGGCFPDRVVEVDYHFAKLADNIGFSVKDILVARNSWCTRARTLKVGKVRESILILEKL